MIDQDWFDVLQKVRAELATERAESTRLLALYQQERDAHDRLLEEAEQRHFKRLDADAEKRVLDAAGRLDEQDLRDSANCLSIGSPKQIFAAAELSRRESTK